MTSPDTHCAETEPHPLMDLLDAEAAALSAADFDGVAALADEKLALLEGLQDSPLEAWEIAQLQERSARNESLFAATLDGLRSVIDRLKHVQRAAVHLDTYTAAGAMQDLGPARSSFEKRS